MLFLRKYTASTIPAGTLPVAQAQAQEKSKRVLTWVQRRLPAMNIHNLTTDWNDGRALCALLDSLVPGTIPDHAKLDPDQAEANISRGLDIAFIAFGAPKTITELQMRDPAVSEAEVVQYLSYLCDMDEKGKVPTVALHHHQHTGTLSDPTGTASSIPVGVPEVTGSQAHSPESASNPARIQELEKIITQRRAEIAVSLASLQDQWQKREKAISDALSRAEIAEVDRASLADRLRAAIDASSFKKEQELEKRCLAAEEESRLLSAKLAELERQANARSLTAAKSPSSGRVGDSLWEEEFFVKLVVSSAAGKSVYDGGATAAAEAIIARFGEGGGLLGVLGGPAPNQRLTQNLIAAVELSIKSFKADLPRQLYWTSTLWSVCLDLGKRLRGDSFLWTGESLLSGSVEPDEPIDNALYSALRKLLVEALKTALTLVTKDLEAISFSWFTAVHAQEPIVRTPLTQTLVSPAPSPPPGASGSSSGGTSDPGKSLLRKLGEVLDVLEHTHCPPKLTSLVVERACHYSNAVTFNALLVSEKHCTNDNGFRIKMSISLLEEWLGKLGPALCKSAKARFAPLRETANLFMMGGNPPEDEQVCKQIFPSLSKSQIDRLSRNYSQKPSGSTGQVFDVIDPFPKKL